LEIELFSDEIELELKFKGQKNSGNGYMGQAVCDSPSRAQFRPLFPVSTL
jgi:hypothetical protein